MLRKILQDIFELFYPNTCGLCKHSLSKGEEHICIACLLSLPATNFHTLDNNPVEQILRGRFTFEKATSYYYFNKEGGMQEAMHAIKYVSNIYLAEYFGKKLALDLKDWLQPIDLIIPIPLSHKKESQRGYNQSYHLAKGISDASAIILNEDAVRRIKNTATQTKMNRTQRIENMKDAFEWTQPNDLTGKHLLLVDDVITTGATIDSCIQAFPQNIDIKISILSLAVAIES
jgi:ComF family protein